MTRRIGPAVRLGVLGAISGALAWGVIVGLRHLDVRPVFDGIGFVQIGPFTLVPGLMFGLLVGSWLAARGRWSRRQRAGYVLASGGS